MRKCILFRLILLALICGLCWTGTNFAATTGKIAGRIVDATTGEGMPGANISIEGTNFGAAADAEGYYFIINIRPGNYVLRATMMGFETQRKTGVVVTIDRTTTVDFSLKPTVLEAGTEVTVVAERAIVPMDVANSQAIIESQKIVENPYSDLGDVVFGQVGIERTNRNDRPTIRGSYFNEGAFMVDGQVMVDAVSDAPMFKVPLGAIQEINVITGGFNAEYGNVRSGVINIVTKDGGNKYSGAINFKASPPGLKHFGDHTYGKDSPIVKPFLDPKMGAWSGYLMGDDGKPLKDENGKNVVNPFFPGWYKYSGVAVDADGNPQYNADGTFKLDDKGTVKPGAPHYGNPYENLALYLWRHRSMENLNALRQLMKEGKVKGDLSKITDDDAVFEYGDIWDYVGDFSFGGPVPFLNKLKFFGSYSTESTEYLFTLPQNSYIDRNATFKLSYPISESMKLTGNFIYSWQYGNDTAESGQGPEAGGYISSNPIQQQQGNKYWYPHCLVPGKQHRYFTGLSFQHILSPATFYEINFNASLAEFDMDQYQRNTQPLPGNPWDCRYLDQGRIGTTEQADQWAASEDVKYYGYKNWRDWAKVRIGDYWYDESPWGYGPTQFRDLTGEFRMSSCNIRINQSMSHQYQFKFAITSQMNRFNLVKAGIDLIHDRLHTHYQAIDPSVNGGGMYFAFAEPWRLGAYIQDKLEFKGMIANVGLRMDYLLSGEMYTPTDDFTDTEKGHFSQYILAGHPNDLYKMDFKRHGQVYFSPRIGISHPVSENAKIFFNYGHFFKWAENDEMYQINRDIRREGQITRVGNPTLKPPRTIQYEVGYAHNILDLMQVQVTGYYKDITDEIRNDHRFKFISGHEYQTWQNAQYRDIRGFEANIDFRGFTYVTGWLNYNYMITSSGQYGIYRYYEDPNKIPDRRTTSVSQAYVRPIIKANMTLHAPIKFGPAIGNYYPLEDMHLGMTFWHKQGPVFTWNPDNIPYVTDNKRWGSDWKIDLRFTKRLFSWKGLEPVFFVDIYNLFNNKYLPYWSDDDYASRPWNAFKWFQNEQNEYMYSLKPGDTPGDIPDDNLLEKGKDYIDVPDFTPYLYMNPRDIFYGIKLNFIF